MDGNRIDGWIHILEYVDPVPGEFVCTQWRDILASRKVFDLESWTVDICAQGHNRIISWAKGLGCIFGMKCTDKAAKNGHASTVKLLLSPSRFIARRGLDAGVRMQHHLTPYTNLDAGRGVQPHNDHALTRIIASAAAGGHIGLANYYYKQWSSMGMCLTTRDYLWSQLVHKAHPRFIKRLIDLKDITERDVHNMLQAAMNCGKVYFARWLCKKADLKIIDMVLSGHMGDPGIMLANGHIHALGFKSHYVIPKLDRMNTERIQQLVACGLAPVKWFRAHALREYRAHYGSLLLEAITAQREDIVCWMSATNMEHKDCTMGSLLHLATLHALGYQNEAIMHICITQYEELIRPEFSAEPLSVCSLPALQCLEARRMIYTLDSMRCLQHAFETGDVSFLEYEVLYEEKPYDVALLKKLLQTADTLADMTKMRPSLQWAWNMWPLEAGHEICSALMRCNIICPKRRQISAQIQLLQWLYKKYPQGFSNKRLYRLQKHASNIKYHALCRWCTFMLAWGLCPQTPRLD